MWWCNLIIPELGRLKQEDLWFSLAWQPRPLSNPVRKGKAVTKELLSMSPGFHKHVSNAPPSTCIHVYIHTERHLRLEYLQNQYFCVWGLKFNCNYKPFLGLIVGLRFSKANDFSGMLRIKVWEVTCFLSIRRTCPQDGALSSDSSEDKNRTNKVVMLTAEEEPNESSTSPEDVLIELKSEMSQRTWPSEALVPCRWRLRMPCLGLLPLRSCLLPQHILAS